MKISPCIFKEFSLVLTQIVMNIILDIDGITQGERARLLQKKNVYHLLWIFIGFNH